MKSYIIMVFPIIALFSFSCEQKDNSSDIAINCENLKNGIINTDDSIITTEISKLITDLSPNPSTSDPLGQTANFETLVARLNTCEQISAELTCYGCIKTLPSQSEIIVSTDSSGVQVHRYIDILTSELINLEVLRIH